MKCINCGEQIEGDSANFCPKCGSRTVSSIAKEMEKLHATPEAEKTTDRLAQKLFIGAVMFLAFISAFVANQFIPASWKIVGPIFCPDGTQSYEVVGKEECGIQGGCTYKANVLCKNGENQSVKANAGGVPILYVVFGIYFVLFSVFWALFILAFNWWFDRGRIVVKGR